jgi:hypothetical protein
MTRSGARACKCCAAGPLASTCRNTALMRDLDADSVDLALTDSACINRGEQLSCLSVLHQGPASLCGPVVEAEQARKEIR